MVGTLLRAAKYTALRGAAISGVQAILRDSSWRQKRLLILCYHGLSLADEHLWSSLYVTADHLASRLELLRKSGYSVLPLGEGLERLENGTLPERSVALTFDDGFADFYLKGQPILREYAVPTTLYLTTYYTTDRRPVFDPLLAYLLWKGEGRQLRIPGVFEGAVEIPRDPGRRRHIHDRVLAHGREVGWTAEDKDQFAADISDQVHVDLEALKAKRLFYLMSPGELADLDPKLIDVQLHTHRHRTPRDESLFRREVADNREAIQRLMPDRPTARHFCYPSGIHYPELLPWLRREGVVSATTCELGLASPEDDPLLLPRFLDSMNVPEFVFASWLAGTAQFLPRRSA